MSERYSTGTVSAAFLAVLLTSILTQVSAGDRKVVSDTTVAGFKFPESVSYDSIAKVLYTSEVGSKLKPSQRDGKGRISKAGLGGKIMEKAFLLAAAEAVRKEKVVAAIPRLEELAENTILDGGVPGLAIAVVYKDEVIYLGGFGVCVAGKPGKAVDADTVFQLASLSKPISSTVVAALVSDGTVNWDSRISDLDPPFQLHDAYPTEQVTILDLF